MNRRRTLSPALLVLTGILRAYAASGQESLVERGHYLVIAGGCVSCHTDVEAGTPSFAGGKGLSTPFGTFFPPNITADRQTGIGTFSDAQFIDALWQGRNPQGEAYFPVFPYTAYTGLSRADVLAMKAYLFSLPPINRPNRPHDLPWYLRSRLSARVWQWLFFHSQRFAPDLNRDPVWNRGAYIVRHLGHCGECHTPRNVFGALIAGAELSGNPAGPDGKSVPNITPAKKAGIGRWSGSDIETFLDIGMKPEGDFAGAGMGQVIDDNTSLLTAEDRHAIAIYLKALVPLP